MGNIDNYWLIAKSRFYSNVVNFLLQLCYTFDAGPNACLFVPVNHLNEVAGLIRHYFPAGDTAAEFFRGEDLEPMTPSEVCQYLNSAHSGGCWQ